MNTKSMPTKNNDLEVESYSDYKKKKVKSLVEKTKCVLIEIKDSSLKEEDKDKMRYELMKMFII